MKVNVYNEVKTTRLHVHKFNFRIQRADEEESERNEKK